ncbi:sugar phosphate isomerase/epimerase family protein [Pedobacter aquatilis]|uniref:sugar phosphate isomerase/epimerase family protein n=1 Tax=Pedobacter aquatilis TaxID=351343 RepID=UPI00292FE521|nr:sugar phosphate isomerase/epimerase family protein [Pedobacter aquatilis]
MDRKKFLKSTLVGAAATIGGLGIASASQTENENTTKVNEAKSHTHDKIKDKFAEVELLAAYFTIAGDIHPFGPTEISTFSFKDRVEAAAKAGYKGFGMIRADIVYNEQLIGLKEMKKILDANGITKVEFEFLGGWYTKGKDRKDSDAYRKDLMRAADVFNPINIKVAPTIGFDEKDNNIPLMVDEFGKLAQEASEHGTNIAVEIMPFSNIRTLETGLAIVQGANHKNGGLLLDIWHINRGNIPYSEIAKIPGQFVKSIELNDAEEYAVTPLWMDTIHRRKLTGEGVFDVKGFISAVQQTGYNGHYGVEVLSQEVRKMALTDMTKKSFDTSMSFFKK